MGSIGEVATLPLIGALSPPDREKLRLVVRNLRESSSPDVVDSAEFAEKARMSALSLPLSLRQSLVALARHSGSAGAMVVPGLPVRPQSLPATPTVPDSVQREATEEACILILIASVLGEVMSFEAEKEGHVVQDVVPILGKEDYQGNMGSATLSVHTEYPFYAHRPDFVVLLCLRSDHDGVAALRVSCIREVLSLLHPDDREALSRKDFESSPPPLFGYPETYALRHAVLSGAPDDPDLRVDTASVRPLNETAGGALKRLETLLLHHARTFRLRPGDLAIVDNRVAAHGRTGFRARFDGTDRWLQRAFVTIDLRPSRPHRRLDGQMLGR
jgi:L-asparagine oxygenase